MQLFQEKKQIRLKKKHSSRSVFEGKITTSSKAQNTFAKYFSCPNTFLLPLYTVLISRTLRMISSAGLCCSCSKLSFCDSAQTLFTSFAEAVTVLCIVSSATSWSCVCKNTCFFIHAVMVSCPSTHQFVITGTPSIQVRTGTLERMETHST